MSVKITNPQLPLRVLDALRRGGDSNPRYPNRVRQFSKLVD